MPQEAPKAAVSTFPVGMKIDDRYEVLGILGTGGFATVYKARHLMIDRDVALKVMDLQKGVDPSYEERFFREAKIAAKIHHNNVVTIYDFGFVSQTGQPYIAMELLEGHDLGDEITKNGPLSPNRAFVLFRPVLEALGEGHRLGIVHKDLKPANLYLTDPGGIREMMKVLDFGVARMDSGEVSKLTSAGQLLGTPRYLAPEYIKSQLVTPAIDVYQMALIISEALTGQVAVDGAPYTAMMLHCTGKIQVADFLKEGRVGEVFEKAFSIDPTQRYQNADEFAAALDSVATHFESNIPLKGGPPQRSPESASHSSVNLKSRYGDELGTEIDRSTGQHRSPNALGDRDGIDYEYSPKKKGKLWVLVVVLLCIVAVGVGAFILLRGGEQEPSPQAEAPKVEIIETLSFRLETDPPGASLHNKQNLALVCPSTPCEHIFKRSELPVELSAALDGYDMADLRLDEEVHKANAGTAKVTMVAHEVEQTLFSFTLNYAPSEAKVSEQATGTLVCESSGCVYILDTSKTPSVELEVSAPGYETQSIALNQARFNESPNVDISLSKKVVVRTPSRNNRPKTEQGKPKETATERPKAEPKEAPFGSAEYCKANPNKEVCVVGSTEFCRMNSKHARCQVVF